MKLFSLDQKRFKQPSGRDLNCLDCHPSVTESHLGMFFRAVDYPQVSLATCEWGILENEVQSTPGLLVKLSLGSHASLGFNGLHH